MTLTPLQKWKEFSKHNTICGILAEMIQLSEKCIYSMVYRTTNPTRILFVVRQTGIIANFSYKTLIFLSSPRHLLFLSIFLEEKMSSYCTKYDFYYIQAWDALVSFKNSLNFGVFSPLAA